MEPSESGETSSGLPAPIAAGIACIFPLIGGIIMLLLERKNRFVRFYALQSIFFALAWALFNLVMRLSIGFFHFLPIIGGIVRGLLWLIWALAGLAFFICWIMAIVKSFSGVEWEMPYIGRITRNQMAD